MSDDWQLVYDGLDDEHERLREALCAVGNGVFVTRGAAEEQPASYVHYPGTYLAGGYNRLTSEVAGRDVVNEDLVNFPNWLCLSFRPERGDWLDLGQLEVLAYRQELDLRCGMFTRRFRVRDSGGRTTAIVSRRLVHMGTPHLCAIEWQLLPEDWSGKAIIRSALDGSVTNAGVARYRQLAQRHLEVIDRGAVAPEGIHLLVRTSQSRLEMAQSARTRLFWGAEPVPAERRILLGEPDQVAEELRVGLIQGRPLRVEKVVAVVSSRDPGISECGGAARAAMREAAGMNALVAGHSAAWSRLWSRWDVDIDAEVDPGDPAPDQLILRLHTFHLLQTASPHTAERDVGIPARGLHGEAYRGHIFWDELFMLPLYVQRLPEVARSVILYRYHRLDAARDLARQAGCAGASFPWQSGSDGREVTQQVHLNPLSGRWGPDYSALQRHVNAAVVYNVWSYLQATGDRAFLETYGAELVLEIARFWSSLARQDPVTGRYVITGVMGPDEYHEKLPGAVTGGVPNNAYTNVTAVWCLLRALDVLDIISRERRSELRDLLHLDDHELARWRDISRRMTLVVHHRILSQFEGYSSLEELDWDSYARRYGHVDRLDRILKAEGTSPDRFKVSKQADVVMLLYLFGPEELKRLFAGLGYPITDQDIRRNVEYYQVRTSHGSTLSRVVFTSAVHRQDTDAGCRLFLSALRSDLYDIQGGTTGEGVHLGAMAGTVDIVLRHYAGLELFCDRVSINPDMPMRLRRLGFRFQHRGRWFDVVLTRDRLRVQVDDAETDPVALELVGQTHLLTPGAAIEIAIEPRATTRRRPPAEPGGEARVHVDEQRLASGGSAAPAAGSAAPATGSAAPATGSAAPAAGSSAARVQ